MRNFEEMKQLIKQIEGSDYAVPAGIDLDGLIADMLSYVGHIDSDLREGVYSTFANWSDNGVLSTDQIRHVLYVAMDDRHLFLGIGESGTDSVFMRAFASLLVSVALYMHDKNPFLTKTEIETVKATVLRYVAQEKDYRGYVQGKGWAHAIAHAADALAHIACVDKAVDADGEYTVGRDGMLEILNATQMLAINSQLVYDAQEDERLAVVVIDVLDSQVLSQDDMLGWLTKLGADIERVVLPSDNFRRINQKHFMRSLYFLMVSDDSHEGPSKLLFDILTKEK